MEVWEKFFVSFVVLVVLGGVTALSYEWKAEEKRRADMEARCARLMPTISPDRAADLAALCAQAQR